MDYPNQTKLSFFCLGCRLRMANTAEISKQFDSKFLECPVNCPLQNMLLCVDWKFKMGNYSLWRLVGSCKVNFSNPVQICFLNVGQHHLLIKTFICIQYLIEYSYNTYGLIEINEFYQQFLEYQLRKIDNICSLG